MALKVSYNNPSLPKGEEVDLMGLGFVKNGGSITLSHEQEQNFVAQHGVTLKEHVKDDEMVSVEGSSELKAAEVKDAKESEA